jgi:hypothetical protein
MADLTQFIGADFQADASAADSYELLPDGTYTAEIENIEIRSTKSGTGSYMSLKLRIVGDAGNGRVLFDMITLDNPSKAAVEIGRKVINNLTIACGLSTIRDTDELLNQYVDVKVSHRADPGYEARNVIKHYAKPGGASQAQTAQPAPQPAPAFVPPPAAPAASASPRPWER